MHFLLRATASVLVVGSMAIGTAAAADMGDDSSMAAAAGISGTFVGSPGGTFATWTVDLPAGQDVTLKLAHWPCNTGNSVGINVWNASGQLATSHQHDACTEAAMFSTGSGGSAEIQVYNYLTEVGSWYTLTADGMTLPGASAMPAAKSMTTDTTMAGDKAMTADSATGTTAATGTSMTAGAATAGDKAMAAGDSVDVQGQTLLGNSGGAASRHDLMGKEGQSYSVKLQFGTDMGGTWNGIGFKVWGPSGWVTDSHATGSGAAEASFTASGNVKYTIEVYNYHHGVTAFYSLQAMASASGMSSTGGDAGGGGATATGASTADDSGKGGQPMMAGDKSMGQGNT